ncbi:DUF302 domain-containing protein [Pseudonocardia benzenivorans]
MTQIDGLTAVPSPYPVAETVDRLAAAVEAAGLTVLARIDHAAAAASAGLPLRPTVLLLFGRPQGGTPLMQEHQTAGIDLPSRHSPGRTKPARCGWVGTSRPGSRPGTGSRSRVVPWRR